MNSVQKEINNSFNKLAATVMKIERKNIGRQKQICRLIEDVQKICLEMACYMEPVFEKEEMPNTQQDTKMEIIEISDDEEECK